MLVRTIFVLVKVNLLKTGTLWLVLCGFINKNTNFRHCGGHISLFKNLLKRHCKESGY